ncbi:MAG: hypothetical protein Q7U98_09230 [Methylicorpusculum sp.]|uniref:hypothetical protein n=1 Tax=Methylicorpusculum sp. TaxID=2713644 RepID=UPI00271ADC7F|nr:hypothetical protein [Methylicorpusculum sp.]MDO8845864.1 hypothetical protein [Methylicorpusculum sp.]MDO8939331.1 hypothetical protein [Methylicorpusculum sp.]MDP2201691.1 hypothetical protein [Methylicorpusculum sp.]
MKLKSTSSLLIGGALFLMSFQVLSEPSQQVSLLEEFHALAPGAIADLGFELPINDDGVEGSAVKVTVGLLPKDQISFKYRLLTNEDVSVPDEIFNDYGYVTLSGGVQVLDYVGNFLSGTQYFDFTEGSEGTSEFPKYTNEKSVSWVLPDDFTEGLYDLGLGIVDIVDADFSSAILLYDVMLKRNGESMYFDFGNDDHKQNVHFQMIGDVRFIQNNFGFETSSGYASLLITTTPDFVPVPGAMLLMGTGLLGLIAYGRKKAA